MPFKPDGLSHETLKKLAKNLKKKFSKVFAVGECSTAQSQELLAQTLGYEHWHEALASREGQRTPTKPSQHNPSEALAKALPYGALVVEGWHPELQAAVLELVHAHHLDDAVRVVPPSGAMRPSCNVKIFIKLEDPTETYELFKNSLTAPPHQPPAVCSSPLTAIALLECLRWRLEKSASVEEACAGLDRWFGLVVPTPLFAKMPEVKPDRADRPGDMLSPWLRTYGLFIRPLAPATTHWLWRIGAPNASRIQGDRSSPEVWRAVLDAAIDRLSDDTHQGRMMSVRPVHDAASIVITPDDPPLSVSDVDVVAQAER